MGRFQLSTVSALSTETFNQSEIKEKAGKERVAKGKGRSEMFLSIMYLKCVVPAWET